FPPEFFSTEVSNTISRCVSPRRVRCSFGGNRSGGLPDSGGGMSNLQSRLEGNSASVWTHIIRQLSICSREMRRQLSHVSVSFGVSDTEVLLLASLASGGPAGLAQTQLATSVGLSPGQVSGLVERLQACGWIALAPVATDRRRHAWRLTASGTELVHQVWQAFGNEAARWDR